VNIEKQTSQHSKTHTGKGGHTPFISAFTYLAKVDTLNGWLRKLKSFKVASSLIPIKYLSQKLKGPARPEDSTYFKCIHFQPCQYLRIRVFVLRLNGNSSSGCWAPLPLLILLFVVMAFRANSGASVVDKMA
jgi:hypothetical protein